MVRVAAISYLNTLPFVYGLEHSSVRSQIELVYCTPAESADKLHSGDIDLAITPIAEIIDKENYHVVSDYCISAEGAVASVLLCSPIQLDKVQKIYLDSDSRTSVLLTKVLCKEYWKIAPGFVPFKFEGEGSIEGDKSYLLIGDKAMKYASKFEYCYDLALEWGKYTSLPFVFALWTSNKELDDSFIRDFNDAIKYGVEHIEDCLEGYNGEFPKDYVLKYLQNNISYTLTESKKCGVKGFAQVAFDPSKFRVRW